MDSPAAFAFRSALSRKGREAHAAGGPELVAELLRQTSDVDPDQAEVRAALIREAWTSLRPGSDGTGQP